MGGLIVDLCTLARRSNPGALLGHKEILDVGRNVSGLVLFLFGTNGNGEIANQIGEILVVIVHQGIIDQLVKLVLHLLNHSHGKPATVFTLRIKVLKDLLEGFVEHMLVPLIYALFVPLLSHLVHTTEIKGRTAHRAVAFLALGLEVPILDAVLTEGMPAHEFAVGITCVAHGALHGFSTYHKGTRYLTYVETIFLHAETAPLVGGLLRSVDIHERSQE